MIDDHIKSEISAYLSGGLTESRNRQIEAHAAGCEKCRQAITKARGKLARQKREALKKASSDPLPNLFLARQGKEQGVDHSASHGPWILLGVLLLGGVGYWLFRHLPSDSHSLKTPSADVEPATVEVSSVSAASAEPAAATAAPTAAPAAAVPPTVPATRPPVAFEIQQDWKGSDSGIKNARLVVIRDEEAWQNLWKEMQTTDKLPPVNFDRHLVVGIFPGDSPAGASLSLGRIHETEDEISIQFRMALPEVAASSMTAHAFPYLLGQFPHTDKKIRLTQKEVSQ